jgi:hypothetical protein
MGDSGRHPGISIHRIAVGGGIMGALFAIGTVLIFVIGVPLGPWFLLASILLGTTVAWWNCLVTTITANSFPSDEARQSESRWS